MAIYFMTPIEHYAFIRNLRGAGSDAGDAKIHEDPDSPHTTMYLKFLDLIGEGELEGFVDSQGYLLKDAEVDEASIVVSGGVITAVKLKQGTGKGYHGFTGETLYCTVLSHSNDSAGTGASIRIEVQNDDPPISSTPRYTWNDHTGQLEIIRKGWVKESFVIESGGTGYDATTLEILPPTVTSKGIYLDSTQMQSLSGTFNYSGILLKHTMGTLTQSVLDGFDVTESVVATQSTEILKGDGLTPGKTFTFVGNFDELLIGIRVDALREQVTEGDDIGTIQGSSVAFKILFDYTADDGTTLEAQAWGNSGGYFMITGKYTSPTVITYKGTLYKSSAARNHTWTFKIYRVTDHPTTSAVQNPIALDFATATLKERFRYPCSALVGLEINGEQFSSLPERGYQLRLLKVQIPSNYFPPESIMVADSGDGVYYPNEQALYTRKSDGSIGATEQFWDGTFWATKQWSANPAWVFYDLATHFRYGLGSHLVRRVGMGTTEMESLVDKWTLYQIARYCDELVSDGRGGYEPRFSCHVYFQTQEEAYKVLNDLASVFRGMIFWAGGYLMMAQDRPVDLPLSTTEDPVKIPAEPVFQFTEANVKDGQFTYSGTSNVARHTTAMVRYVDPLNNYKAAYEYVEDAEGVVRYGINQLDLTAFACTSRSQARAAGRYALAVERVNTEMVTFRTGMEGMYLKPGDIIAVLDSHRSGCQYGGRLVSMSQKVAGTLEFVLDRVIPADQRILPSTMLVVSPKKYLEVTNLDAIFADGNLVNINARLAALGYSPIADLQDADGVISKMRESMMETFELDTFDYSGGQMKVTAPGTATDYPDIVPGATWGIQRSAVVAKWYRVVVSEEAEPHEFEITAVEYNVGVFDLVDLDEPFEEAPMSVIRDIWKSPPVITDLHLSSYLGVDGGKPTYYIEASWEVETGTNLGRYDVYLGRDRQGFQKYTDSRYNSVTLKVDKPGSYQVWVVPVSNTGKEAAGIKDEILIVDFGSDSSRHILYDFDLLSLTSVTNDRVTRYDSTLGMKVLNTSAADATIVWKHRLIVGQYDIVRDAYPYYDNVPAFTRFGFSHYKVEIMEYPWDLENCYAELGTLSALRVLLTDICETPRYTLTLNENKLLLNGPHRKYIFRVRVVLTDGSESEPISVMVANAQ